MYLGTTWNYRPDITLHVRTSGDPMALAGAVRSVVRAVDPALPVFGVATLQRAMVAAFFQQRLAAALLTAFGVLAVVLASVGLYASMSYAVARRTRELGIRVALGATRRDIARLIAGRALRITAVGVIAGTVMAAAGTRLFAGLLFGVTPTDPATFGAVVLLLVVVALVASAVPARRAASLNPVEALHHE